MSGPRTVFEKLNTFRKDHPHKSFAIASIIPTTLMLGASLGDIYNTLGRGGGEFWSAAIRSGSWALEFISLVPLVLWGDRKITAEEAKTHKDIQDAPLWTRLTSPREAPAEFSAAAGALTIYGLTAAAVANPTVTSVLVPLTAWLGTLCYFVAERKPTEAIAPQTAIGKAFHTLNNSAAMNWVREKPIRAAFYCFSGTNYSFVAEGLIESNPAKVLSGLGFQAVNHLRKNASKRAEVIENS
jgi:hypothetical protein